MERINCNVTRDLLPLYIDDVVSQDSRILVKEHLESCEACRNEAEKMNEALKIPIDSVIEEAEAGALIQIRKMLRTRRFWTIIATIVVVIGLWFCLHMALHVPQILIPYDEDLIQINVLEDGSIRSQYCGETYNGFVGGGNITVTNEDGTQEVVTLIYYYHSPWSKYIEPLYTFDEQAVLKNNSGWFHLNNGFEIEKVYYAAEAFSSGSKQKRKANMLDPEYPQKYLETAVLIWSEDESKKNID